MSSHPLVTDPFSIPIIRITMHKKKFLQGTIKRHPDGFGFFIADTLGHPDVYIPRSSMQGVMTNDKVLIDVFPERGGERFRGEIIRILQRGTKQIVGRFHLLNDRQALIKDEGKGWGEDLKIPLQDSMGAREGQLVTAQIVKYPEDHEPFTGKIIEIIGDVADPMNDIKRVLATQNIPVEFSAETLREAKSFPTQPNEKDFKNRRDLRPLNLVTIDGATAKDFDDAVYVESNEQGFLLYVAIADVSHYVSLGTAMDRDAYERGTSVYFPNYVVPMLPEALSNGLCSLNPHVPRLCLVAEIQFDFTGTPVDSDFYEAVMESKARLTYGQAQDIVDGTDLPNFAHVKDAVLRCADLAKILMAKRFKEGSLDLEIPETELEIDAAGVPVDIIRSERLFAHRLIEEMMLAANVAVATFLSERNIPALYRIHEPPNELAIKTLERYLWNFGGKTKLIGGGLQKRLTRALEEFEGRPEAHILNILTLRSMSQAKYSPDNVGHFGLGFHNYTHFTSPIRRYPDLIVHRLLKNQVVKSSTYRLMSEDDLATAGTVLSAAEQRSVKAERQVQSIKKARFMQKFIGQELEGMISSVAKFGIFVLLREYDCDGLVRVDDLGNDKFEFDEEQLRLVGKRSGRSFNIGENVRILVSAADPELGQVNFLLAEATEKVAATPDKEEVSLKPLFKRDREPRKPAAKPFFEKRRESKRSDDDFYRPRSEKSSEDKKRPEKPREERPNKKIAFGTDKSPAGSKYFYKGRNMVIESSSSNRSRKLQFADRSKLGLNKTDSFGVAWDDENDSDDSKKPEKRPEKTASSQEFKGGTSKNRKSDRKDSEKRSKAADDRGGVRKARVSRHSRKNKAR